MRRPLCYTKDVYPMMHMVMSQVKILDIKIPDYYACGECGKVFANDKELSEHKALIHDEKYVLLQH